MRPSAARPGAALKRAVAERARGCCKYCRCQEAFSPQTFSVEHVVPLARSGANTAENLAFSCQGCNAHKSDKREAADPVTADVVPLFHPRTQRWQDHFVWGDDFSTVIGLTPTGRATVVALRMNRESVRNLRRVLRTTGFHPPQEAPEET